MERKEEKGLLLLVVVVVKYNPAKQNVKSFKSTKNLTFLVRGREMLGKIQVRLLLKNTFLFFLSHLAFVLLQSSLQMLIFFFCPGSKTGNKIIFLRGGQSQHSPLAPHPGPQREWASRGLWEDSPAHQRPLEWSFRKLLGPSAGSRASTRPHRPLTASPARPGPWRARRACSPGPPAHPAGVARVASGPQSSASLQRIEGSLPAGPSYTPAPLPSPSRLFQSPCTSPQTVL